MSNINFLGIDENFPIPGTDNPSEGFRTNFSVVKNSLREAKTEIENLESTTAKLNTSNDFSGNSIVNANLITATATTFNGGTITSDRAINFADGFYQTFLITNNITLSFLNFPTSEKFSVVRLVLKGTDKLVSFISSSDTIFYSKTFPAQLIVNSNSNPQIIDVWYQESSGYHLQYLGEYNTTRSSGLILDNGTVPIASQASLGVVKIGTGLTIDQDGTLSAFGGDYNNLINKITDINQLTDTSNLLFSGDYDDLTNVPDIFEVIESGNFITSDNIVEQLNLISGDIQNDTLLDSIETAATPSSAVIATKILTLSNIELIDHFQVGQKIKIFGASTTAVKPTALGIVTAVKNGFTGEDAGSDELEYKIALFELSSGGVSPAPGVTGSIITLIDVEKFNLSNNIALSIERTTLSQGILIYRRVNSSTLSLIDVVGSKDLGSSLAVSYVDYFDFDRNIWSKKSETNSYISTTGTIHFPLTAPGVGKLGWVSSEISAVNSEVGSITLLSNFFFETQVLVVHDDTQKIQSTIDSKSLNGVKSLTLGNKKYIVSQLSIPDNFVLSGSGSTTSLRKLPWSSTLNTNKIIQGIDNQLLVNIRLENFSIDGNMQNQYMIDESQDDSINYSIDIKGTNISFFDLTIDNVINGGISSVDPNKLIVRNCSITNSGMSDRYASSPLICDNGNNVVIINNNFKNFADGLDSSLTNTGIINGNIVENCGSGILIFGSLKLVSTPNLILGPAGEFIPGPDLFNSEFDAVNIVLEDNTPYISDSYVYQENGEVFDLTANRAILSYRVDKLRKINNVEELYGEVLVPGVLPGDPTVTPIAEYSGPNKSLGQFKFAISSTNVNLLKTTFSFSTLKVSESGHVGLVYRALLTEYVPVVDVDTDVNPLYSLVGSDHLYEVVLENTNDLNIGARVKFLGHGGTPSLDSAIGTIISINTQTKICIISYDNEITVVGSGGRLTRENTFVLAKGKIQ